MDLFFWSFLGLAFLFWLSGWKMSAKFRNVPKLEPGAPKPVVKISVIIPARNEEKNLSRLLPSLRNQVHAPHEIIVVNDQSEDRTGEVARENGAVVVGGRDLPEGWYGKPWACQQGADASTGDWFLFLDADTVLEGEGLLRIGHLATDETVVHSVCPYHRVSKAYEQLSSFFNVIMILGMNAFTTKGSEADEIGLFGQAMLISRSTYEGMGGHEKVKDQVLENFHLSRFLDEAGHQ